MGLLLRAGRSLLGAAAIGAAIPSCYSAGGGTAPPSSGFYFPVGLAVPAEGDFLFAINSDFDLQFNGGTLQTYDLPRLRADAARLIQANLSGAATPPAGLALVQPSPWTPNCTATPPPGGFVLGQSCAPPIDPASYMVDDVVISAFATDLQVSLAGPERRLFAPVRGVAAVTWATVGPGGKIECGRDSQGRCDSQHDVGNDPNQPGNTRNVTMPGEPFGMAQTPDGTALVVTHQTDTKVSLLTTGLGGAAPGPPVMQFVLDGLPMGGIGIAAIPHDADAPVPPCENTGDMLPCVRPAFLETNNTTAQIDLVRYYDDDGSSLHRPFLQHEGVFPLTSNAVGTDSRGIAIDPTPRIACKAAGFDKTACSQLPARVFFSSRTPPALGLGELGGPPPTPAAAYNPDRLVFTGNVPLPNGPSKVYLAPIVNRQGNFELRVFVVLFDSNEIAVYDPAQGIVETYIDVGPGPFGMAFDPFSMSDVAQQNSAGPPDAQGNRPYRYAYVTSFTQSFVQMIDLDQSQPSAQTYERVVFTLGQPTLPIGQ